MDFPFDNQNSSSLPDTDMDIFHEDAHQWKGAEQEGKLAVDIVDSGDVLLVISTIAGVLLSSLDVSVHGDVLTIRGNRPAPQVAVRTMHHQECFWGTFSRTIILPVDVIAESAIAEYKQGILVIRLQKATQQQTTIPITVVDDEEFYV